MLMGEGDAVSYGHDGYVGLSDISKQNSHLWIGMLLLVYACWFSSRAGPVLIFMSRVSPVFSKNDLHDESMERR